MVRIFVIVYGAVVMLLRANWSQSVYPLSLIMFEIVQFITDYKNSES
jgi:hypothetical protein